jgi:hypothetical protein
MTRPWAYTDAGVPALPAYGLCPASVWLTTLLARYSSGDPGARILGGGEVFLTAVESRLVVGWARVCRLGGLAVGIEEFSPAQISKIPCAKAAGTLPYQPPSFHSLPRT